MPTITGTNASETLIGTSDDDTINALGGNDIIDGAAGADTMNGGTGDDVYIVDNPGDLVVELEGEGTDEVRSSITYTLPNFVENLVLTGSAAINASGNSLNNIIIGNDAANVISGGGGSDIFIGRGGDDQYVVEGTVTIVDGGYSFAGVDQVVEEQGEGTDSVTANISYTLGANIENLTLTGTLDLSGFGNELNNVIIGNSGSNLLQGFGGNDYLDGGAGADHLIGGDGDDTYVIDSEQDVIGPESPSAEGGTDTVVSSINYTLAFSLENLTLTGAAVTGTGNSFANIIIGNAVANTLSGEGGNDTISGLGGNDTISGGFGDDIISGGAGLDTLSGGSGSDTFRGTIAELNGDTITDIGAGDSIILTDADLSTFTLTEDGNTLSFTGGSITFNAALAGHFFVSAAAGGGVKLEFITNDARQDFNGDGRSDVLWRNDDGSVSNWLGQTNGGFIINDENALTSATTDWQIVGVGDFNGDGRDDLLWRSTTGQLSDWLANRDGGYTANDANAMTTVATSWQVAGIGDFNGDGRDDIVWRNTNGELSDWLGNADGGFTNNDVNAFATVPTSWHIAGVGDFNADGRDDILWRNDNGQVSNWLGQANGGFVVNDAIALTNAPSSWHIVGVGDFNGDNRDDILWRNDNGQLSDWLATPGGGYTPNDAAALVTVATDWHVAAIGDYDGDGRDDILWRNDAGQISDWLGQSDGSFALNDPNAFTDVATNWHVQDPSILFV